MRRRRIAINVNGMISGFHLETMQTEHPEGPKTYPVGRKCQCCGCNLSIYNGYKYCAQCQDLDTRARKMRERV